MNKTEQIIVDEIIARSNMINDMRIIGDILSTVEQLTYIIQDKEFRAKLNSFHAVIIERTQAYETTNNKYWSTLLKERKK